MDDSLIVREAGIILTTEPSLIPATIPTYRDDYGYNGRLLVPFNYTIIENKYIINPGSVMMNRSSYGFGTFAIVTIINDELEIKYYHSSTFEECTDLVLNDGILMLEEFKKILK